MRYKVLVSFVDLKDKNHKYIEGDIYPRSGGEMSDERIGELAGYRNKRGIPLIAADEIEIETEQVNQEEVEPGTPKEGSGEKKKRTVKSDKKKE